LSSIEDRGQLECLCFDLDRWPSVSIPCEPW